jgi:hypothetical protein
VGGASVSGSFTFTYYVGSTVSGNGTSTAPTNAGTYTVVAAFASSNPNYANSQSAPVTFSVGQATPVVVASDAGGTYNGNPFAATATATGIGGASVSGSFTFTYYVGSTVNGNGSATPPTNVGTYTVVAAFSSSNPNYANTQSGPDTFTITQAHTTTALASSASSSVTAQNVTFTATVALTTGGGVPLGNVSFLDGTTTLATVALSNFSAQFTTSILALGNHSITAVYSGNANFSGSGSTALTQSVQTAVLESDPTAPGHMALFVGGTSGNDLITLAPGSAASTVKVTVTESSPVTYNYSATFSVATADRIFVFDGTGNDTIKIGAVTLPVAIKGGNGNDTFQFTAVPVASSTIQGGTGTNTLVAPNVTNSWTITALNAGSFDGAAFTNVQNLTGNAGVDTFTFGPTGSLSGLITGGGGSDQLIGANIANTWDITGTNAGTLNGTAFSGIKNLTGGSAVDVFQFMTGASVGGTINGGGGGDWLDYSTLTTAVTVNLASGTATHTGGVTNIQNVRAGSGNANLTGNSLGNILVGGSGANTITGGSGRSLLIGGKGKDTIKGGSGDDILISGYTDYDDNNAALMAVFAEWGRTDETFQQRISNIRGTTTSGLNGSYDLNSTTVHDDGVVDTLTGNGGLDWFWAASNDKITDLQPGDQVN